MRIPWTEKKVKRRNNGNGWMQKRNINRADRLEKQKLSGKTFGTATKSRGRQGTKHTDSLNNFVTRNGSPNDEPIRKN